MIEQAFSLPISGLPPSAPGTSSSACHGRNPPPAGEDHGPGREDEERHRHDTPVGDCRDIIIVADESDFIGVGAFLARVRIIGTVVAVVRDTVVIRIRVALVGDGGETSRRTPSCPVVRLQREDD